jgi:hypothetical protein
MKKIRIFLTVLAVVVAVGGTIASQAPSALEAGYQFIPASSGNPAQCNFVANICDQSGTYPCKVNSAPTTPRLWRSDDTACVVELNRIDPPPAP